ncbi:MAG: TrkA C-terminal domain-containing protein, partial [Kofleriaceae bacterium]
VVLTAVVIGGKIVSVALGAFLVGSGTRTSIAAGMSLAQIGEFSFIIAGLGISLGAIGEFLYPIAVAVSAITTLTTPWLIKTSSRAGSFVDRKLPKSMQTFVALYESWIERLRSGRASHSVVRRLLRTVLIDVIAVAGVVIAVALGFDWLVRLTTVELGIDPGIARIGIAVAVAAVVVPFCVSIFAATDRLAAHFADTVVPRGEAGAVDLGRAPRVVLTATLRIAGLLLAGLPLVAVTQAFLPGFTALALMLATVIVLTVSFWRSTRDLHGHVRAASHVILEALAAQSAATTASHPELDALLPGLTAWESVEIPPGSRAIEKSLAQLDLRGATGATVLAISRHGGGMAIPDAHEALRAGDVLAITGSRDAIAAAITLLKQS